MPLPQQNQSDVGKSATVSAPVALLDLKSLPFKVSQGDTFTGVVTSLAGGTLTVTLTKTQEGAPAQANAANMSLDDLKSLISTPSPVTTASSFAPPATMMAGTTLPTSNLA